MNSSRARGIHASAQRAGHAYFLAMRLDNLYFTCGAEMDVATLRTHTGGGEVVSIARVAGYRLAFFGHNPVWDSGIETLIADDAAEVWGVLYRLGSIEWERLDSAVGASLDGGGAYFHYPVEAETPTGKCCAARTYRKATRGEAQPPSHEYLAFLVTCALRRGLPTRYIEALKAFPTTPARYPVPKQDGSRRRHLHIL